MAKDKTILLRVSADEKKLLAKYAKDCGMSVSEYLLAKSIGTIAPGKVVRQMYAKEVKDELKKEPETSYRRFTKPGALLKPSKGTEA